MMTAFGGVETAVQAMRNGAYDFVTKPFDHETIIVRLEKALERSRPLKENVRLQMECQGRDVFQNLVGNSIVMNCLYETIQTKLIRVLQEKEIKPLGDTKPLLLMFALLFQPIKTLKKE